MKKWNKLLALLLAMVMALGTTVTAYADGEEATEPAEDVNTAENVETTEEPAEDAAPAEGEDAAAAEAGYTDVTEANWFYEAVTYVTDNGLVDGETETTFAPNTSMTRADLVTALYRLAGSPETEVENPFTDVAADAEYYDAVMWGYANGVVGGITETTYEPDSPLQRQQIATMLYRYLNDEAEEPAEETETAPAEETETPAEETAPAEETETAPAKETETAPAEETETPAEETETPAEETETAPAEETETPAEETETPAETTEADEVLAQFVDADQVQAYAKEAMAWAVTVGLFSGDDKGALDPRGDATRAEVAIIIMRFAEMTAPEAPEDAIGGTDEATDIAVTDGEEAEEPTETTEPVEEPAESETTEPAEDDTTDTEPAEGETV